MADTRTQKPRTDAHDQHFESIDAQLPGDRARRITVIASGLFFVGMLGALWSQHARFGDHVFDAGIFDQGIWLLSRFREPFVTLRGLHLFGDHSSYVLILLTPLYWIWADVRMALAFLVACVAVGALLIHAIARSHRLAPWAATGLAMAYLLNPVVWWQAYEDFHPEIVAIPCLLGAYLLSRSSRPWWALAPLVILLFAKEDAAFVVIPLGVVFAATRQTRRLGITVAGLGLGVLALNLFVLLPHFSPTGSLIYTGRYERFGASLGEIVINAATDPGLLIGALANTDSVAYLAWTVLPLFLAILAPEILAIGLPITVLNLASSFSYQQEARRHYTVYFITIVALAAVVGAARLARFVRNGWHTGVAVGLMLGVVLVSHVFIGPYPPHGARWTGPVPADRVSDVERALAMIPAEASLAADTYIATRLAHRTDVYKLPNPWVRLNWGTNGEPLLPPTDTVEWVAAIKSVASSDPPLASVMEDIRADGDYVVRYEDDLLVVLQRR